MKRARNSAAPTRFAAHVLGGTAQNGPWRASTLQNDSDRVEAIEQLESDSGEESGPRKPYKQTAVAQATPP